MLDRSVHMDYHGACVAFTSTDSKIDALVHDSAKHGHHMHDGKCAEAPTRCEDSHGYKICASREGAEIPDIIELDTIHAWHKGRCHSARAHADTLKFFEEWLDRHHIKYHDGPCRKDLHMECRHWHGAHVCRSDRVAADWGGEREMHVLKKGHCVQFAGAIIKDAAADEAIAKRLASRGLKAEEGGCKAAGFDDRVWHKHGKEISFSVWTK